MQHIGRRNRAFCARWTKLNPGATHVVVLALGLTLLANSAAAADDDKRSISVTGTVETKVAPDEIVWRISLSATDTNLAKAKARSDEQVKSVVALRDKLRIAEGDLETGTMSVNREYERDARGMRGNFKGFVVSRSVTIRERDLKRFDEFLDTLVASTEMEVYFNYESIVATLDK